MPRIIAPIILLFLSLMACSSHNSMQRTESYESDIVTQRGTVERGYLVGVGSFLTNTHLTASDITIEFSPQLDSAQPRASPYKIKIGQLRGDKEETAGFQVQAGISKADSVEITEHNSADIAQQQESTKEPINWRTNILGFLFGILTYMAAGWLIGKMSKRKD